MAEEEPKQKLFGVKVKAIIAFMMPLALVILVLCGGIAFVFGAGFKVKSFITIVSVLSSLTAMIVQSYFQSEEREKRRAEPMSEG